MKQVYTMKQLRDKMQAIANDRDLELSQIKEKLDIILNQLPDNINQKAHSKNGIYIILEDDME